MFYRGAIRRIHSPGHVFITFDDGPHPEATEEALAVLDEHNMQATFFLLGNNCIEYPEIAMRCKTQGHGIGNHGLKHIRYIGKADTVEKDVLLANKIIHESTGIVAKHFRPPYGFWMPQNASMLRRNNLRLTFWSLMPGDFLPIMTERNIYSAIKSNVREGDIIVLHDNDKTKNSIRRTVKVVIEALQECGLRSIPLPESC